MHTCVIDNYPPFGRCLAIDNGIVQVYVTLDTGPRIIRYGLLGQENHFYEDTQLRMARRESDFDGIFGEGQAYRFLGGHRLWTSPEHAYRTYTPDNQPVDYELLPDCVVFTPPAQEYNGIQIILTVTLADAGTSARITASYQNLKTQRQTFAPWQISMMRPGGTIVVPQSKINPDPRTPQSDRVIALWPYDDMADDRINWGSDYITLSSGKPVSGLFRLGVANHLGWCAYLREGQAFIKKHTHMQGGHYPDQGTSCQVCMLADRFVELETLGELIDLAPGQSVSHSEQWQLLSLTADEQAALLDYHDKPKDTDISPLACIMRRLLP